MAYVIVVFTKENETALVPQSWLKDEDTVCYWPPYTTSARLNSAVQKVEPPGDTWSVMSVRALYRSDSYQKARLKLKQSCVDSDLQTDEDVQKRKRRAPNRIPDSSDEDVPEKQMYSPLPNPPAKLVFSPSSELSSPSSSRSTSPVASGTSQSVCRTPQPASRSPRPKSVTPQHASRTPQHASQTPQPASHRTPVSSGPEVTPSNSNARQDVPLRMTHATATRMFTLLEKVVQEQREQRQLLQLLLVGGGIAGAEDSSLPEGVTFPLETEEEANNLDDVLANPEAFAAVVKYLSAFGGQNVKDTISRMLKKVMTNKLALKYSLLGRGNKSSFAKLLIVMVIFKCLNKNRPTKHATMNDMELVITKWLAGARDRDGGRNKRVSNASRAENDASRAENDDINDQTLS